VSSLLCKRLQILIGSPSIFTKSIYSTAIKPKPRAPTLAVSKTSRPSKKWPATTNVGSSSSLKRWTRRDSTQSFRWDPAEDRRYALRFADPSTDKGLTVHGANRLACIALPLFTAVPMRIRGAIRLMCLGSALNEDGASPSPGPCGNNRLRWQLLESCWRAHLRIEV
jgi:hypothetical protein